MFSERLIDDIEKKKERGKSYYFRKAARRKKDGTLAPEAHRRLHGAPKDAKWHSVAILTEIREDFARIQNTALKRNGFSITVDHRSLKAQRKEALAQGDTYLANLLARVPEEYIGIISPLDAKSTAVKRVLANRALISEQRDILYAAEKLKTEISDLKLKDTISDTLINVADFMKSAALDEARDTIDIIDEYEKDIEKSIQDVNFWKNLLITAEEAELQAKEEYMTEEEKKYMQGYHDLKGQVEHWTEFIANLNEPEKKTDAWEKYNEIKIAVTHRLMDYQRELKEIETTVHKINERLSQEPYSKSIKDAARNILKENASVHKELEKANTVLTHQIESLRQIVHNENLKSRPIFTLQRYIHRTP